MRCEWVNASYRVKRTGGNMADYQADPSMEKFLTEDLEKLDIKVKKIQYKMDFGTTEILIKMGLN
jgi:hypothetical protein